MTRVLRAILKGKQMANWVSSTLRKSINILRKTIHPKYYTVHKLLNDMHSVYTLQSEQICYVDMNSGSVQFTNEEILFLCTRNSTLWIEKKSMELGSHGSSVLYILTLNGQSLTHLWLLCRWRYWGISLSTEDPHTSILTMTLLDQEKDVKRGVGKCDLTCVQRNLFLAGC